MVNCDTLIRNANVFDGSGADGEFLDVAIREGRITAIGPSLPCRADESIDGQGLASRQDSLTFTRTTTPP